jgi:hypothetical protein
VLTLAANCLGCCQASILPLSAAALGADCPLRRSHGSVRSRQANARHDRGQQGTLTLTAQSDHVDPDRLMAAVGNFPPLAATVTTGNTTSRAPASSSIHLFNTSMQLSLPFHLFFIVLFVFSCGSPIRWACLSCAAGGILLKRAFISQSGNGRDISGPPSTCLGTRTRSICRAWVRPHSAGAPQPAGAGSGMRSPINRTGTSTNSQSRLFSLTPPVVLASRHRQATNDDASHCLSLQLTGGTHRTTTGCSLQGTVSYSFPSSLVCT